MPQRIRDLLGKQVSWKMLMQAKMQNGSMFVFECNDLPGLTKTSIRQGTTYTTEYVLDGFSAPNIRGLIDTMEAAKKHDSLPQTKRGSRRD